MESPTSGIRTYTVPRQGAGQRADVWVRDRLPGLSRAQVVRHFRAGRIWSQDRPLKPSSTLREGERVVIRRPAMVPASAPPPLPPILYEDDRLLAFDKPPGMLVHPAGGTFVWALIGLARRARPHRELHLAHRLDRHTSGVVVLARDPEANRHLKEVFHRRYAEKIYLAVCEGDPPWTTRLVDAPIGDDPHSPIRIKHGVRSDGQDARTRFFVRARFGRYCLVACHPRTGRTHQLRIHLAHLGHPIVGDRIYGRGPEVFLRSWERRSDEGLAEKTGWPRQALHAQVLRIPHPDGHPLEIRAPLPPDLVALLQRGPVGTTADP